MQVFDNPLDGGRKGALHSRQSRSAASGKQIVIDLTTQSESGAKEASATGSIRDVHGMKGRALGMKRRLDSQNHVDVVRLATLFERRGASCDVAFAVAQACKAASIDVAGQRSLLWNYARNEQLRSRLEGSGTSSLSAMEFVSMSAEELADEPLQKRREDIRRIAQAEVVIKDCSSFRVVCPGCGDEEAMGMCMELSGQHSGTTHFSDAVGRTAVRGKCAKCGLVWTDTGRGDRACDRGQD